MALDRQIDFTGGLNTRIPAHKLPENMVQSATNVDFSHGDIRPDKAIGGDGGGQQFFYEKGATWVSNEGIGGRPTYPITVVEIGATTNVSVPSTDYGNPVVIKDTGILQIGMTDTVTATHGSNLLTTASGAHGLVVNDTITLAGTDVPAGLVAGTTYFIKTVPATTTMTLSATAGGSTLALSDNGSGTITLTSVTSLVVNNTELNLGSVSSFVEYSEDLYMGRDEMQFTSSQITSGSMDITLSAVDIPKVITSDLITGAGIPKNTTIDSVNYGTSKITISKPATATATGVLVTIGTTPVRLMDGIVSKIYPIEIPTPKPLSSSVSQLLATGRSQGTPSYKWFAADSPIPFQYGIARFDDASGAEAGISELTSISESLANIDSSENGVSRPILVKHTIDKTDANSALYGKFALYRAGGTSSVLKKVSDIYLTSQTDGTPLSVDVARSSAATDVTTSMVDVQVSGLPNGAEWKVKWNSAHNNSGGSSTLQTYSSKSISSITIGGSSTVGGSNYTAAPSITIAAPTGSGGKTATATAVLSGGKVTNIIITEKGNGYIAVPSVTIGNANSGSDHATGTAVVEGVANQGETTLLTTTSVVRLYGISADHNIDLHFIVKFTSDAISGVTGAPFSDDFREYIFAGSNILVAAVTGDDGIGTHAGCGSVIDFTPPRALIEIEPISDPVSIPYNLKFLTEYNNFFIGAVDKRLHISNYAKPNNFAIDGYIDFDAQITGIISRGGEAVVFTEYGVFRVYGSAHNEMRKVQVPTVHGLPVGAHKTISKIKESIMYVSHAGISHFDGKNVTVLSDMLLQDFTKPSSTAIENVSGVFDDTYYLLTAGNNGWKVDMKSTPRICQSTNRASNLHYRGVNNRLYSEAGYVGGAVTDNTFTFETRDFTGGNITAEKAYYTVYVTGTDFSGTVNIKCDGVLVDTYSYPAAIAEFNRALSISTAKVANRASIEFVDCTGRIASVSIKYDLLADQVKKRFNSITLTYTGTPTVLVKLDSVTKISSVTLTDPGTGNTGTSVLYFPSMTEGHLPHITTDETETSRISGFVFDTETI